MDGPQYNLKIMCSTPGNTGTTQPREQHRRVEAAAAPESFSVVCTPELILLRSNMPARGAESESIGHNENRAR